LLLKFSLSLLALLILMLRHFQVKVKKGSLLLDVLLAEKLISSKGDGRRLIEQKGITVNDAAVTVAEAKVEDWEAAPGSRC
jgi:tyrosyl-tRNA synthetase